MDLWLRITYMSFTDKGRVMGRNMDTFDTTKRFHLVDERLVQRVPPNVADARERRSGNGAASHQMIRHRHHGRRIEPAT